MALVSFIGDSTPALADLDANFAQLQSRDYSSVLDFGAVGDGTTDDTAAWQAAIDASHCVRVPGGLTFKITGTVYLRRGLRLIGDSMYDSIIDASSLTVPLFSTQLNRYGAAAADQGFRDGTISNIKIIGNTASSTNQLMYFALGLHRVLIERVWFYSCGGDAINIDGTTGYGGYYNTIRNCVFGNPSDFSTGSDSSLIKGNGIYCNGSINRVTVADNVFWRIKKNNIELAGTVTWGLQDWSIRGNGLEYAGFWEASTPRYGVYINPNVQNVKVTENYIEYCGFNADAAFNGGTPAYLGGGVYCNSSTCDLVVRANHFSVMPYFVNIASCNSANIDDNTLATTCTFFAFKVDAIDSGLVNIGKNPVPNGVSLTNKYLSAAVAIQPKVIGDAAYAIKFGNTCLAGKFTPRLYGASTEITCSSALGYYERDGDRLRVNFTCTVSNLNAATGLIGIAGSDGINLALPGLGGTVKYPFRNDAALLHSAGPLYTSLVNLSAGYYETQLIAAQNGAFFAFLREQGDNVANQNLNATALAVGSVLRGEFYVYV